MSKQIKARKFETWNERAKRLGLEESDIINPLKDINKIIKTEKLRRRK